MKTIRGGMGLGDALYVQAVCRHLPGELVVRSAWPDVFRPLAPRVKVAPFSRAGVQIVAHYPQRKKQPTTQFEDCCISAGIQGPVELRIDWRLRNQALADALRSHGRPILCVQLPRSPMGRTDGFGAELLPRCEQIQKAIDRWIGRALIVQVGAGKPLHRFTGIDVDLAGTTTVSDLLDVASVADAFLGYVSFLVPLAECFDKPGLFVWSRRGLECGQPFIRSITPKKILHKPSSRFVMDDATDHDIHEAADALL